MYRELAPPRGLEAQVACVWRSGDGAVRVLPDACVDVVWSHGGLIVAGPATGPDLAPATPGQPRCGVRFRVGMAGAALGIPAHELRDGAVALAELWGRDARRLEDAVATAADPLAALVAGLAPRLAEDRDAEVREAVVRLRHADAPIDRLARDVALSERQLRRRFERAVGYGPRTLRRVLRFQRFLALAQRDAPTLARLAADAGYADQAHLARECRELSGLPPSALLAEGAAPAGETADSFKAPPARSITLAA
jgi:AraC-like DNA-binding protein